jgi:uncharacterized protein (DUF2147 family)
MEERMRRSWLAVLALAGITGPALSAEPMGDWLVAGKLAAIRVAHCGNALCGNIAWTKGPPGTDRNNPDPAKRNRSMIGLPIILNMKPAGANRWEGEIYNAEDGKTYSGRISLASENVLRIEGCVLGFLCGGQDWTRAKCEEAPAAGARTGGGRPAASASAPAPRPTPSLASCREVAP